MAKDKKKVNLANLPEFVTRLQMNTQSALEDLHNTTYELQCNNEKLRAMKNSLEELKKTPTSCSNEKLDRLKKAITVHENILITLRQNKEYKCYIWNTRIEQVRRAKECEEKWSKKTTPSSRGAWLSRLWKCCECDDSNISTAPVARLPSPC